MRIVSLRLDVLYSGNTCFWTFTWTCYFLTRIEAKITGSYIQQYQVPNYMQFQYTLSGKQKIFYCARKNRKKVAE